MRSFDTSPAYDSTAVESGKLMAVLSYLPITPVNWIVSIICLVQRNNAFSLYHAKQALALCIATLVFGALPFALVVVSLLGPFRWNEEYFLLIALQIVIGIVGLLLAILGIANAASGKYKPLPLVGGLASALFGRIRVA